MTQYWGPRYWYFLHSLVASYPEIPSETDKLLYQQMFILFVKLLPCTKCFFHFTTILKTFPPNMTSRNDLILWGFNIHNKVNIRLNRKPLKLKHFNKMYQEINHQYLYDFIMYNFNRAYQNQIPYNDFVLLINMSMLVFPCVKCRKSYRHKYKKDNLGKVMHSRIELEKWIKHHFRPDGYHLKKKKKVKVAI